MKKKHNKKNNSLFLFEILVRKSLSFENRVEDGRECLKILKTFFFNPINELSKEIGIFRSINESRNLSKELAEKILEESKKLYSFLDKKKIDKEKKELSQILQSKFGKEIFNIFVPNYRNLATIHQIMNKGVNIKNNVLLEQKVLEYMQGGEQDENKMVTNEKLVIKTFSERFNKEYGDKLSDSQKNLLKEYVLSFSDNGLSLKTFLNEEVEDARKTIQEYKNKIANKHTDEEEEGFKNIIQVINILENFKKEEVNRDMVHKMLKIQQLVKEIKESEGK